MAEAFDLASVATTVGAPSLSLRSLERQRARSDKWRFAGSIRRAGNRLRITVQLIDVNDGHHLWSERYDREMDCGSVNLSA